MKYTITIFCCVIMILTDCLYAQNSDTLSVSNVDPVVITGTRISKQKSEIPASISVISRSEIEQSGVHNVLPLLAEQVPGLFLNTRNMAGYGVGPNTGGNISIRGISGTPNTRVLMLIDGQPQFMGIFGHPIADAYTASDIERVEVIRGAGAVLYGSNAFGGAINIITREPREGLQLGATAAYGSFNTGRFNIHSGYKKGKLSVFAAANYERTDGFRSDGNDEFQNTTGYVKVGYTFNPRWKLILDGNIADAEFNQPGPEQAPTDADQRDYLRTRTALSLENTYDKISGALKFFYNYGEHDFSTGFNSEDFNRGITFYQNLRLFEGNVLTLGVDVKNFGGEARDETLPPPARVGFDEDLSITETDVYALLQQKLWEKFTVYAGIRLINNSEYGNQTVPNIGAAFQLSPNTTFKAAATKAFRSPAIIDLFLFPPANEDLQPEELWSYEISVGQTLFNRQLNLELAAYYMEGDNLIQEVVISAPPPTRINTGSFINKGIELDMKYISNGPFQTQFNYQYLASSRDFLYAPAHDLNLKLSYEFKVARLSIGMQHVSDLNVQPGPDPLLESYTLVNSSVAVNITSWLTFFVEGNNLLDTDYQIDLGYPLPGANVLSGVKIRTARQ